MYHAGAPNIYYTNVQNITNTYIISYPDGTTGAGAGAKTENEIIEKDDNIIPEPSV